MEIKKFLSKNNNNKGLVFVQGLGFVGAVMSLVVSNSSKKDYAVIIGGAREESIEIIENINKGIFPIKSSDPKIEEYHQNSIKKGNLLATYDTSAYSYDVSHDCFKTINPKKLIVKDVVVFDVKGFYKNPDFLYL